MVEPIKLIQLTEHVKNRQFLERFNISPLTEDNYIPNDDYSGEVFKEAVFANGKSTIKPIEEQFQVIKDRLTELLEIHTNSRSDKNKFNPFKFMKDPVWKELENRMTKIFGFRNVDIVNWAEVYREESDEFSSCQMNCITYPTWRYPIEGIVTDNGFYDGTKSINTTIAFSMGIIKTLSAAELTAIFLHEFGHNIDPAIVDIKYIETNKLSKYLTNDKSKDDSDKKENKKSSTLFESFLDVLIPFVGVGIFALLVIIINLIQNWFFNADKAILQIKTILKNRKEKFSMATNTEAYADNFARMYGYAPQLMTALKKMTDYYNKKSNSRIKNEKQRQRFIAECVKYTIKDVHGTFIDRAYSLLKEYEKDLNDPNIPKKVKEAIKEDSDILRNVLEEYTNNYDEFTNRINKMILEELKSADPDNVKSTKNASTEKPVEEDKSKDKDPKEDK